MALWRRRSRHGTSVAGRFPQGKNRPRACAPEPPYSRPHGRGEHRIGISAAEAAEILGIHELSVSRLLGRGILRKAIPHRKIGLDRADVERIALERNAHRDHRYWTTTAGAAEILGVTANRVRQLVDRGFLPAVRHDGRWYLRRHQVEVIANARESRKLV
jgi:Helix-turn-helix domain